MQAAFRLGHKPIAQSAGRAATDAPGKTRSVRLEAREFDHLGPLFSLVGDEVGGRPWKCNGAPLCKPSSWDQQGCVDGRSCGERESAVSVKTASTELHIIASLTLSKSHRRLIPSERHMR